VQEEEGRLIDMDQVTRLAVDRVESSGIVFLDEIDKIAGREGGHGPDVSREGVQRDILPIVEGTTVNTRYGMVRTDFILFIAAGAFHVSKPSDLIPELQGRFPIRVELTALTEMDFVRILTEPKNALIKQYSALLETEGLKLTFGDDATRSIMASIISFLVFPGSPVATRFSVRMSLIFMFSLFSYGSSRQAMTFFSYAEARPSAASRVGASVLM